MSAHSFNKSEPYEGGEEEHLLEGEPVDTGLLGFAVPWAEDFYTPDDSQPPAGSYKSSSKESNCCEEEPLPEIIFRPHYGEEEEMADEEESSTYTQSSSLYSEDRERKTYMKSFKSEQTGRRRKSLFVHSSPTHFPDINRARKSVFGSIFLRTSGHVAEDTALLRTVAESNYSMLQSLLDSFDKILSGGPSDTERKQTSLAYKESLLRILEHHGIRRTYSDGSVHWDIYPITQSYLFSVQVGDHVHQTRNLSRIEDRIVTGPTQTLRLPYEWPTKSVYTGHWDFLGMAGNGTYVMPHGVTYTGKMSDGMFHDDDATLTYPNKFKALHCVFEKGKLLDCQFQFPDLLDHEKENWTYCKTPDRRFWSEVKNGLKSGKIAQKTELDPARKIPVGCYDTNDGFYNPKSLSLLSPTGELLRVPVCKEDIWIKKNCRKGFYQPTDYRPDLFENWFNYDQDLINSILKQQDNFRKGKITFLELQQFYADNELLLPCSPFKRRKTPSETAMEEYFKSIPKPKVLKSPKVVTKHEGHKLPSEPTDGELSISKKASALSANLITGRKSKSSIKFSKEPKPRTQSSHAIGNARSSKISFKLSEVLQLSSIDIGSSSTERRSLSGTQARRSIPEKYLQPQPILRPPFTRPAELRSLLWGDTPKRVSCIRKNSSSTESLSNVSGEYAKQVYEKRLKKFMKEIIMEAVTDVLLEERERHRMRLKWAQKIHQRSSRKTNPNETCLKVLEELFESIPDKEEYCDSFPETTCDLKKLAEDQYNILKYWGNRMFMLEFTNEQESLSTIAAHLS